MAKFEINTRSSYENTVEADSFASEGEFVDFHKGNTIVFRMKAALIETIKRVDE